MKKTSLVLLFLFFSGAELVAKDFGVQGQTFPIKEESFLAQVHKKLKIAEKEGKIAKLQNEMKQRTVERANRLQPVDGITKATENQQWVYDPSISLPYDLKDQVGKVFYHAGTQVNPLDKIPLSKALIFIDGDDAKQVSWALKENKKRHSKTKLILVKGGVIDLMRSKKIRFYFDQNGTLTKKFSITHVPALIEQGEDSGNK
ncbi:MAG: type-F conjugative transfer system protein TraW, partial [Myxococcaceae bacterium]